MARKSSKSTGPGEESLFPSVQDYRHDTAKRTNIPPAKIAAEGTVPLIPKARYHYSPRRPPELRFDPTGAPDRLPKLLEAAQERALTPEETQLLADALREQEPWLEWAEKREQHQRGHFEVDPVALHIHERVSAQAILRVAARQDPQRDLFADPQLEYHQAVQFYRHDVDWSNRLILGDSLQAMSSLARREDLAGKVQMIYMDPPYGIKFASNFQSQVGNRDVKDKEQDLTREPEMVKAYRDTWHLGVHSYLSYLRDRLMVAKELLADSGSIFVQISDENLHRVRQILDDVFGNQNFVATVCYKKPGQRSSETLNVLTDFILWYARDRESVKYRQLYTFKSLDGDGGDHYNQLDLLSGEYRTLSSAERSGVEALPNGARVFETTALTSAGSQSGDGNITVQSKTYSPPSHKHWSVSLDGLRRVAAVERILPSPSTLRYKRFFDDFPVMEIDNRWDDIGIFGESLYVVRTADLAIQRCMLMTTDPGDLVLDPTCGSGTTAYVAEQWGRRWITADTSRVAVAIARQRLMTAKYEMYALRDEGKGLAGSFKYTTVPHVTLKSISQNTNLDPIFAKHEPILDQCLVTCNAALGEVTDPVRAKLRAKLTAKQARAGKKAVTDADERRWSLPKKGGTWEHWQMPFDADADWPKALQKAVTTYRAAWRAKMDAVNGCIAANADQEELVDQPEVVRGVTRVSGPFTVEAVQPPELSLSDVVAEIDAVGFDGEPEALEGGFGDADGPQPARTLRRVEARMDLETQNLDAYLDKMLRLLRGDGVRFPNNKQMKFTRLNALSGAWSGLHAEGRWMPDGQADPDPEGKATLCAAFGPQYGPVTAKLVEELVRAASRRGYDDLVIAGFSFDGPAQATIEEAQHPKLRIHMAHVRPDVNPGMDGLLKEQPGSQLFTVFGQPRVRVDGPDGDGMLTVTMEGVDIYNPVTNEIVSTGAAKVAAWFLDSDYDGRTFCITQAFFPDRTAWEKLAKALKGVIDPDAFEAFSGTKSLPFAPGANRCIAIKVIDPRGNEVMKVQRLG